MWYACKLIARLKRCKSVAQTREAQKLSGSEAQNLRISAAISRFQVSGFKLVSLKSDILFMSVDGRQCITLIFLEHKVTQSWAQGFSRLDSVKN